MISEPGYIKLVATMGSDIDIVNAARVSFDKEVTELSERDKSLINYLVSHHHDSVFRHCAMTFEVYAPLMVARQWYKHAVASTHLDDQMGWNESSRRYITEDEQFYIPKWDEWRSAPESKKQGSGKPVDKFTGVKYTRRLEDFCQQGEALYKMAIYDGIAPEQARLFLPAYALNVRWRWTASLNAILHFLTLRLGEGAQSEIVDYADEIRKMVNEAFPYTYAAWRAFRGD